jgi:hypothetical protein
LVEITLFLFYTGKEGGLNPDMASWLIERLAKQRERKLNQEVYMAKVLLVAKCLDHERKQLVNENQK